MQSRVTRNIVPSVDFIIVILVTMIGLPCIAATPTTASATTAKPKPGTTQPYRAPAAQEMRPADATVPTTNPDSAASNSNKGWTLLFPGTHRYYISSSAGSDTGNGSVLTPFKTIARGLKALKPGDDLLLKRGDSFYENFGNLKLNHNTFGAYGPGERPAVYSDTTTLSCISVLNSANLRFVGLHLSALHRDPTKPDFKLVEGQYGITCTNCSNILIEDCLIEYFNDDVAVQGTNAIGFRMRRCVIRQAYSAGKAFSQGIYLDGQRGAVIEECVFDTCGWNATLMDEYTRRGQPPATSQPAAGSGTITLPQWITGIVPKSNQPFPGIPNMFNHAIYNNQNGGAGPSTIRNCIFINSASTAVQQRPGGIIDNCLFVHNGMATDAFSQGDWGQITNNVVLGSKQCPPWAGGGGLTLHSRSGIMQNNIVAHGGPSEQGAALVLGLPGGHQKDDVTGTSALFDHNVVYDWPSQGVWIVNTRPNVTISNNVFAKTGRRLIEILDMSNVTYTFTNNAYELPADPTDQSQQLSLKQKLFPLEEFIKQTQEDGTTTPTNQTPMMDPTRTIESYAKVLGLEPALDAFVAAACLQSRDHWDPRLTAPVINDYFREGFSMK